MILAPRSWPSRPGLALYQRFILDVTIDMVRLKQAFDGREAAAAPPSQSL